MLVSRTSSTLSSKLRCLPSASDITAVRHPMAIVSENNARTSSGFAHRAGKWRGRHQCLGIGCPAKAAHARGAGLLQAEAGRQRARQAAAVRSGTLAMTSCNDFFQHLFHCFTSILSRASPVSSPNVSLFFSGPLQEAAARQRAAAAAAASAAQRASAHAERSTSSQSVASTAAPGSRGSKQRAGRGRGADQRLTPGLPF